MHLVVPKSFNDAPQIADQFKDAIPVILNLQSTDTDLSKRLIDFASGLTYALDGGMQRIADKVFLLTPRNVEVSAEERARLSRRASSTVVVRLAALLLFALRCLPRRRHDLSQSVRRRATSFGEVRAIGTFGVRDPTYAAALDSFGAPDAERLAWRHQLPCLVARAGPEDRLRELRRRIGLQPCARARAVARAMATAGGRSVVCGSAAGSGACAISTLVPPVTGERGG